MKRNEPIIRLWRQNHPETFQKLVVGQEIASMRRYLAVLVE